MSPIRSNHIILRDGRSLGYGEIGDPGGKPIFYFHGFPGSRLEIMMVASFSSLRWNQWQEIAGKFF
jgi:hypothetical protein